MLNFIGVFSVFLITLTVHFNSSVLRSLGRSCRGNKSQERARGLWDSLIGGKMFYVVMAAIGRYLFFILFFSFSHLTI